MSIEVDSFSYGATSIIQTFFEDDGEKTRLDGTGFFYHILGEPVNNGPYSPIEETYLVTNRHLLFVSSNDEEIFASKLVFGLKLMNEDKSKIDWDYIELDRKNLITRTKIDKNSGIDVAVIRIGDIANKKLFARPLRNYLSFYSVTNTHFPKTDNGKYFVEVGDDVLIIGYPYGYYDSVNLYPIVKSGMIASSLYNNFEGQPCFLIDAKLFPGSSGSLVVSKPQMFRIINGELKYAKVKQIEFLGIYSADAYKKHDGKYISFNVGKVWKWYVIDYIIRNGMTFEV